MSLPSAIRVDVGIEQSDDRVAFLSDEVNREKLPRGDDLPAVHHWPISRNNRVLRFARDHFDASKGCNLAGAQNE